MKKSGVYWIINKNNKKLYVGSSINIMCRLSQHKHELRKNIHDNQHLQNAWNKYGEHSFLFEIIFYCPSSIILEKEQEMMDRYKSADSRYGYNICPIAGNCLGIIRSEETKAKMRGNTNATGRKGIILSKETRMKISEAHIGGSSGMLGKRHSNFTRKKMSLAKEGRKYSEETKLKMSETQKARWKIRLEEKRVKEVCELI